MMKFTQGNLLEAPAEALVNTVNTLGVMGKGIALMFKEAFPANFPGYEDACKRKEIEVGHMFVLPSNIVLVTDPDYTVTNLYGLRWDAPHETAYPSTSNGSSKVSRISNT
jgi:O-acetyl-ADP-ribose deacetylase (regulator of RNase III)